VRVFLSRYRSYTTCSACRGRRLQPEALCFKIEDKTLPDLWRMAVSDLLAFMGQLRERFDNKQTDPTLHLVLQEVHSRLFYLDQVGLGYLSLDRATRTLSGGEIERVNLTACLGASLTGTLFVLDEPTVGLHGRDIERLVGVMHRLRDLGNTLVVVEHEQVVMEAADHLIDLGPGAGQHGGKVIYAGPADVKSRRAAKASKNEGSLAWLDGRRAIPIPKKRRKPGVAKLQIRGASRHNLRKLDVELPLGMLVCLTGVSGSGKSTLAHEVIHQNLARKLGQDPDGDAAPIKSLTGSEHIDAVELVDQSAVARTPRSTPALFLGAFDAIRQLFCEEPAAKAAELKPGYFSFNSGDGRCDRCAGNGFEKVEMQFLSDLYVTCPDCQGRRYKSSTLEYQLDGLSIADVLELTVEQAVERFVELPEGSRKQQRCVEQIQRALKPLMEVGLGYLRLGQPLNTLSGGESQRLKLCKLLQESADSSQTRLLILDEPTTGLHFTDIERLLGVFQKLVDAGHSLLVIEHNVEVIKSADWILDLGPEAGADGGQLVGEGTPEALSKGKTATAKLLRQVLGKGVAKKKAKLAKPAKAAEVISLRGARHHNLKNLSVDIPREQLVVVSGLSGSGKSTLAFDILFAEGQRRFLDSMSTYARQFAEQLEKPELDQLQGLPPTVAIEQRVSQGGGKSTVATVTEVWNFARLLYAKLGTMYCPDCQIPVERQSVSSIENTIRKALGKGEVSLLAPIIRGRKGYHTDVAEWALKQGYERLLVDGEWMEAEGFTRLTRYQEHDIDVELGRFKSARARNLPDLLSRALQIGRGVIRLRSADGSMQLLSTESSCPSCHESYDDLDPRLFSFNSPHGWCPQCRGHGVVAKKRRRFDPSRYDSVLEAELDAERALDRMDEDELVECPSCEGSRLNALATSVRFKDMTLGTLAAMPIDEAAAHFESTVLNDKREKLIARDILPEIRQRLAFLQQVGLGYLQLNRSGTTLSGGESQRIRLAAQLGSNLRGVLYVLDEPTIGLHPRDNEALLSTLTELRNHGNSLIIVEHDEDTIAAADYLIDLGPAAGRLGGEIVYEGPMPKLKNLSKARAKQLENSPTLRALREPLVHPIRGERRKVGRDHPMLELKGCEANNLKRVDIKLPLGRLCVMTGISGSGKSTLMHECIGPAARPKHKGAKRYRSAKGFEAIKSCHEVDQAPIGKTSRSCPATYVKVFDHIRALFAQLPDARVRGYDASRFSFNTEGGRCPECKGNGRVKLEMDFLPATWVHCESCEGLRYNPATLEVRFKDRSIGEVLAMTIDEAADFFESQPRIAAPLRLLADTGLGYLQLGQPSPTLSGGEAQRIKLVAELIKGRGSKASMRSAALRKRNLYLIEEPTVGLHQEDIRRLIDVLHRLVDEGHTVVVIEHHMDVAAEADWILDLGPEAGEGGGRLVAWGTPEKIARSKKSRTAPFLAHALD
ncbi:MAG: excinuclease ABC subunit A, partial [Akkermansiaceae bacterium]|nr:excinuclease ABC subunit A [Akkermansiaceae bacterium]